MSEKRLGDAVLLAETSLKLDPSNTMVESLLQTLKKMKQAK